MLLFMAFMGVVIGLLDMGASKLVTVISGLKKTEAEVAVVEEAADETVAEVAADAAVEEASADEAAAEGETAAE